ncbi:MAG: SWIM zinc finger family protein [Candidatus Sericytochromatia bacterium]|nr:SWIM zinc finger family protein [Candidatus Sericytochromatia bacterium]
MSYFHFSGSGPQKTQDGIRLQSSRGGVGTTWWGQRWVSALEKLCDSGRLTRGKNYARQGQVLSIDIAAGRVLAKVQGTRTKPYTVSIELPLLNSKAWAKVRLSLAASPLHLARLLAGEMSAEMDLVFKQAGVSLFPEKRADLETDCSCPDWSDPCKHIAAVYYLLAEQFDADPFLLFRLRGQDREDLLASLGASAKQSSPSVEITGVNVTDVDITEEPPLAQIALPSALPAFWRGAALPSLEPAQTPAIEAPLLKRLKSPPLWRGESLFLKALEPIYSQASQWAQGHLGGEVGPPPENEAFVQEKPRRGRPQK